MINAVQIIGKAIIRAWPKGPAKTKTATRKIIVGAMFCNTAIVDKRKPFVSGGLPPHFRASGGSAIERLF